MLGGFKLYKIDYHTHTNYSADSDAPMETMICRAIALGLTEMAMTDHVDYMYPVAPYPFQIDYDAYLFEFNTLRDKYANQIRLTLGVEFGLGAHLTDTLKAFVSRYPFEFVIGSVHDYHGDEVHTKVFWEGQTKHSGYMLYFNELLESVRNIDDFNVVGHMDYIMRYSPFADNVLTYDGYREVIDEILRVIVTKGKGLELNTSGFRYGLDCVHPQLAILERYRELGGEIVTVGSDAHYPRFLYERFDAAYDLLRAAGFKAIAVFRNRKPVMLDIAP